MIYAIRAVGTEYIKFGLTTGDAEQRLRFLQVGCPFELVLEAQCPGGREAEVEIHYRLLKEHHRGEWFKDCPEAQQIIKEMKADALRVSGNASVIDIRLAQRHKRLGSALEFSDRKTLGWV